MKRAETGSTPRRALTLFDSTNLIVGVIIGVGIYQMAPEVARGVGSPLALLGIWVLGGLLSLLGAMSYAELATAYPEEGGDYVYLSKAYGRWAGFLFGWAQMVIVRPGDIVIMAFAFATYARASLGSFDQAGFQWEDRAFALGAVVVLTAINIAGVREGKTAQNILTILKVLGLLVIVAIGFSTEAPSLPVGSQLSEGLPWSLALIFVLFTYGGWNEMAYVAAEVHDPKRNIKRALILGTVAVTALYVAANGAFLSALGFEGMRASQAVAADTVDATFSGYGSRAISIFVCISALGAINGLIFAGARISYAVGRDHRFFRIVGQWQQARNTPTRALLLQGGIATVLIIVFGSFANALLYTSAVVYSFYFATTLAVIVLRRKDPTRARFFRVPGYPATPLVFAGTCLMLVYSAATYKPFAAAAACILLGAGYLVYRYENRASSDIDAQAE